MQYMCAHCGVLACCDAEKENMPKTCPMQDQETLSQSMLGYDETLMAFAKASAEIEAEGYCEWSRVRETIAFCEKMGYHKIGLAFCKGLKNEAKIFESMLRKAEFEVYSVICKTGGVSKRELGIEDAGQVRPGTFEPMCNPIAQAHYLNGVKTDFNIVVGLCVGHDSLFYKHSDAMVTTLIAKDRVLAHNPAGALYLSEGYYKQK